jgi:transcriptional regulator with XRE-family HTH domain
MPSIHTHRTRSVNDVGAAIRRFRERVGLSTRELARKTGVAASYVSKIELGQLSANPEFCERVSRVLRLPESERDLLGALLALQSAEHHPVPNEGAALAKAQQAVRRLEWSCRSVRTFQLAVIPGLLQTREYAQAILERCGRGDQATAVRERLARQKILRDKRRTFRFVIADWALEPHWCSPVVMRAQLAHLRRVGRRPNVQIRILRPGFLFPKSVPPLGIGFEILDEGLVIVDSMGGFTTHRHQNEVARYVDAFDETFRRISPP